MLSKRERTSRIPHRAAVGDVGRYAAQLSLRINAPRADVIDGLGTQQSSIESFRDANLVRQILSNFPAD